MQRKDHFMPPDLLESQLELLEEPSADERAIVVTIDRTPNNVVRSICDCLSLQ
jgi:gluconokinase